MKVKQTPQLKDITEYDKDVGIEGRFHHVAEEHHRQGLLLFDDIYGSGATGRHIVDAPKNLSELVDADEVRDLFIRLQSGTALTRQQIRDAWPGTIGPFIVRLAGKMDSTPSIKLFKQIDRRGAGTRSEDDSDQYDTDRQFCAQLLCIYLARESDPLQEQSIGANDLDKLYHDYTTFDVNGETAKRFLEILKITSSVFLIAFAKTIVDGKKR